MTAPSIVGYTARDGTNVFQTLVIDNVSYSVLSPASASGAQNVGCIDNGSNGHLQNTTGATKQVQGIVALSGELAGQNVEFVVMTSSTTDAPASYSVVASTSSVGFLGSTLSRSHIFQYTIDLPAGHYVAIGAKNLVNTANYNCAAFFHFIRSIDGDYPALIGDAYSTYVNSQQTTSGGGAWKNVIVTTTASGVGIGTNNAGSLSNTTGVTQVVDGFIIITGRKPSPFNRQYLHKAGIDAGGGFVELVSDSSGSYIQQATSSESLAFAWYTTTLNNGNAVNCQIRNIGANAGWQSFSYQNHMRSRAS